MRRFQWTAAHLYVGKKYMRLVSYLFAISAFCLTVSYSATDLRGVTVRLGDNEDIMRQKMISISARNVTDATKTAFYGSYLSKQKYYWWELRDHTIVAILLVGKTDQQTEVVTIEIGESGKGIDGIARWRDQKLISVQK